MMSLTPSPPGWSSNTSPRGNPPVSGNAASSGTGGTNQVTQNNSGVNGNPFASNPGSAPSPASGTGSTNSNSSTLDPSVGGNPFAWSGNSVVPGTPGGNVPPSAGAGQNTSSAGTGGGSPTGSGGQTFFVEPDDTPSAKVVPFDVQRSEHIANYFSADLTEFVRIAHLDLANELNLPPEYFRDNDDIIAMLYDDLAHMLRDERIVGIHLLLSDKELDSSLGAYPVRYHVQYTIEKPSVGTSSGTGAFPSQVTSSGRFVAPPAEALRHTQLHLLIDWNVAQPLANAYMRRPKYNFDWVPEASRFDATTVMYYHGGNLSMNGAKLITKSEKY